MSRLHHMGITVSDTEEAVAFYRTITGGEVIGPLIKSGPAVEAATGYPGVVISLTFLACPDGDAVIEFAEYQNASGERIDPDNGRAGAAHAAFEVDDLDAMLGRLTGLGYASTSAPMTATAGPIYGWRYVYIIGPDDVRVELLERPA